MNSKKLIASQTLTRQGMKSFKKQTNNDSNGGFFCPAISCDSESASENDSAKKIDKPIIIFISHFLLALFPLPSHSWFREKSLMRVERRTRAKERNTFTLRCVHVAKINIGTIASITNKLEKESIERTYQMEKGAKTQLFHSYTDIQT